MIGPVTHDEAVARVRHRSMFEGARWQLVRVVMESVPHSGNLVDLGVGNGGVAGYLGLVRPHQRVIGFCRFERGVTKPTEEDEPTHLHEGACGSWGMDDVKTWLSAEGVHNVSLFDGDVRDTLKSDTVQPVAFASIDLNLYAPTLHALEQIVPACMPGAAIVVDDWYYHGVRKAIEKMGVAHVVDGHMAIIRT